MELFAFDWSVVWRDLVRIATAGVLALPVAFDREISARRLGLRTFPLVAVASCAFVLLARVALEGDVRAQARVLQGIITGIGFLGGGAIVKSGHDVRGTATAASIWLTAALGAAVGFDRLEIAIILAVINLALLRLLVPVKDVIHD